MSTFVTLFTTRQKFCRASSLSRNSVLPNPCFIQRKCFNGMCVDLNPVIIFQPLTSHLQTNLAFNDIIGYFKESCVSLPV